MRIGKEFLGKALCIFAILILLPCILNAQGSGSIKGRVIDKATGDELIGANVVIRNTSIGASTDINGNYLLRFVPTGVFTIRVSYIGYQEILREVVIVQGDTKEENFQLTAQTLIGEEVIVTAQARGQDAAINQQITSNTISNIVAADRIKELPDVNAAESIGRLPGVAINRYGGEATQVSIRGLSPKYNLVTVNGVALPATGDWDRSTDLSLISSNMLHGIELKKAVTPDMDADAIGGTVDLKLKEAPEEFAANISIQGGYNQMQKYYGNYNISANVSNRFFDNLLGVVAGLNFDNYDRSADKFQGGYRLPPGTTTIYVQEIAMREEKVTRKRSGGNLLLDLSIPYGKVNINGFYNQLNSDGAFRINRINVNDNRHYYDLELRKGKTEVFTGYVGLKQDYHWIYMDISFSHSFSKSNNPEDKAWTFAQENGSLSNTQIRSAFNVPNYLTVDTSITGLRSVFKYSTVRKEEQTTAQLNFQVPFQLGENLDGYIKFGGKFRRLIRDNDQEQFGRDAMHYNDMRGNILPALLQKLCEMYPASMYDDGFIYSRDSANIQVKGLGMPVWMFLSDYSRSDFLDGNFPLGISLNPERLMKVYNALQKTNQWFKYYIGSLGRDYMGTEELGALYFMMNLNITGYLTIIPGVRWERDISKYTGQRYREVDRAFEQLPPVDYQRITNTRNFSFVLPALHIIIKPADWLKIRLARTETLTRPDYMNYAPITYINNYQSDVTAANSTLRPARSKNYDAALSVFQSYIGLFSVAGFYKEIKDLIFWTRYYIYPRVPILPELNIPVSWYNPTGSTTTYQATPRVSTFLNNRNITYYRGFELEWQTRFWYLPSILQGLVFNINYSRIYSKTNINWYKVNERTITFPPPPRRSYSLTDTVREARMPDQPSYILNTTLGFDYKDFSVRLSYLFQTDKTTSIDAQNPVLDTYQGKYYRWDMTAQQKIGWGITLFANFTNLNNRRDDSYRGASMTDPSYFEYYGFTMDLGIRYTF